MEYHIISTLCIEENSKPITWAPSPLTGVHIVSSQMIHTSHGHLPFSGAHNVSSPSHRERHTQLMGIPTQGHTTFHLRLREEPHTHIMGFLTPHKAHNVPSPSQRGTTHSWAPNSWASSPTHEHTTFLLHLREEPHTQLMGFLSGRLTQSVSWRMSHADVIINTPSQLGRHSPSGQVSHGSTRTSSWL
jgi:hypothetical protein